MHDAEEALFRPGWLRRRAPHLVRRFPRLSRRLLPNLSSISRGGFAAMAAEEFVLLLAVTFLAASSSVYYPWLALFLAFGLHLAMHLVQWIAVGRYVPSAATALLGLLYFGWGVAEMINSRCFTLREFVLCGVAGCIAAALNLRLLHAAACNS